MTSRTDPGVPRKLALGLALLLVLAGCSGENAPWEDVGQDARQDADDHGRLHDPGPGDGVALDGDATEPPFAWQPPAGEMLPSGSVITPEHGGTVVTDDGRIEVSFPPGAVEVPTTVSLGALAVPGPPDASDLGLGVTIEARDPQGALVTRLAGFAYLYFHHDALEFVPDSTDTLVVHAHDDVDQEAGGWSPLATVPSPDGGTAMARTDHFSGFGLYAPALTGFLGCQPGGGCRTSINQTNPIASMGMDHVGNLYFMHPNGPHIYRRPSGGGPGDVEIFFNAADAYGGTWLHANRIAVSDRTGDVFLLRAEQVFRIRPDSSWTLFYPAGAEADVGVQAASYDPNDGTLWVQCRDGDRTDSLRQLDPSSGLVVKTVAFNAARRVPSSPMTWTFDSQGRLFAMDGWSLVMLDDPVGDPAEPWKLVAEGFPGNRRSLASDAHGNVFVATGEAPCLEDTDCTPTDQMAVVSGTPAFPNERIAGTRNPILVVVARDLLLVSSGDAITTLPLGRRDLLDGNAGGVNSPSLGSLSGRGSFVKLGGTLASSAAHHAVWMAGIRLPLAQVLPGELRFTIPGYTHRWDVTRGLLPDLGRDVRMSLPTGEVSVRVGPQARTLGAIQTPEPGRYKPTYYSQSAGSGTCLPAEPGLQQPPLEIATGEWVYWHEPRFTGAMPDNQTWSVVSRDGLFPTWVATEDGPWMAYRFTGEGDYTFDWVRGDRTLECTVRVSAGGAPSYVTEFQVDPAAGGTFYNNGARIVIPAGALPGAAVYGMRLTTSKDPPPASSAPQPDDAPLRYRQFFRFDPEPDRLHGTVRFGLPLGQGEHPVPTFFDNGMASEVPLSYRQSMYVPIEHEVDAGAGYVDLVLPAGDYAADSPGILPRSPRLSSMGVRAPGIGGAVSWLGHKIKTGVNEIGGYLWWKVGMPNEKVEDEHFTILYNTREGMTESRAMAAHAGLVAAWDEFSFEGYKVPEWTIVTLDPNLATEGSTSGLGRLKHWNMALGGWQTEDDLRSAAAHELFHVIQYENMSYDARAKKFLWQWWMEGTAVWAEAMLFPESNSAADWVAKGSDFIHAGLANYGSLTEAQAYSCVALIMHLEKTDPGAVLQILQKLSLVWSPDYLLRERLDSMPTFLDEFALSYFGGVDEPYKSWDLSKAFLPPRVLANPSTSLIDRGVPGESAVAVKVATDPSLTLPVSFDEASGSVIRTGQLYPLQTTFVLDNAGQTVGALVGTTQAEGLVLPKASTFTPANGLTVIHVFGEKTSTAYTPRVVFEVPTLDTVTPATFHYGSNVDLTLTGGGFGPGDLAGRVLVFYGERVASVWSPDSITVPLPANTVTPMEVPVQVRNRAGVLSNTRTVSVTGE